MRITRIPTSKGKEITYTLQTPKKIDFNFFTFDNRSDIEEKILRYSLALSLLDEVKNNSDSYYEIFNKIKKTKNKLVKTTEDFTNYILMKHIKEKTRNLNFNINVYTVDQWELVPISLFEPNTDLATLHLDEDCQLIKNRIISKGNLKKQTLKSLDLAVVTAADMLEYEANLTSGYKQFEILKYIVEQTETPIYPIIINQKEKNDLFKISPSLKHRITTINYSTVSDEVLETVSKHLVQKGLYKTNIKRLMNETMQLTYETLSSYKLTLKHLRRE